MQSLAPSPRRPRTWRQQGKPAPGTPGCALGPEGGFPPRDNGLRLCWSVAAAVALGGRRSSQQVLPPTPHRAPYLARPSSRQCFALPPAGVLDVVKCGPEDVLVAPEFAFSEELIGGLGGKLNMRFLFREGGARATLAALTGAKDSSRLPGRDELSMCWGNALRGWALREGRSRSGFQVGVAAPCSLLGEPPSPIFLCPSPFYFLPWGRQFTVVNVTLNRKEKGIRLAFLKSK